MLEKNKSRLQHELGLIIIHQLKDVHCIYRDDLSNIAKNLCQRLNSCYKANLEYSEVREMAKAMLGSKGYKLFEFE
jgi:hypothetical protein